MEIRAHRYNWAAMILRCDLALPATTRLLLLSDLHVGDGSPGDLFGRKDTLLRDLLAREAPRADLVVVNGDAFDHLQARSQRRIERAHPEVFAALRTLAERTQVVYVPGNHEDLGALRAAFPAVRFADAIDVGGSLCLTHGHQFDLHWGESFGEMRVRGHGMAQLHAALERTLGRPIRQPFRDYDNWPNRVVHRLFYLYTQALRLDGLVRMQLGRPERYRRWQRIDNFWARGQWGDLGALFQQARAYLVESPWQTLVLGHAHQPGVVPLDPAGEKVYANLGSWALEQATFGWIAPDANGRPRITVHDAHTGQAFGAERYRMLLDPEAPLPDMKGWFARYYRGFFRYDVAAIRRDFPAS